MKKLTYKELGALFEKAKAGDTSAFAEIFNATYKPQLYLASSIIHNQALAEEAVQNTYLSLYKNMNAVEKPIALVSFMNRLTVNNCYAIMRKEKESTKQPLDDIAYQLPDPGLTPEEKMIAQSDSEMMQMALSKLDPTLRDVVILKYVDEMKMQDIAKVSNLSLRTTHRYLKKGVIELKNIVERMKNSSFILFLTAEPFIAKNLRLGRDNAASSDAVSKSLNAFQSAAGIPVSAGTAGAAAAGAIAIQSSGLIVVKTAAEVGIVALGTSAAVSFTLLASPMITVHSDSLNTYTAKTVPVTVTCSNTSLKDVRAYDANGTVTAIGSSENGYLLEFAENGTYRIVAKGTNGKTSSEDITISNIDRSSPVSTPLEDDGTYLSISLSDSQSGINWNTLRVCDSDHNPVEYHMDGSRIFVASELTYTEIYIEDNLGNANTFTIRR